MTTDPVIMLILGLVVGIVAGALLHRIFSGSRHENAARTRIVEQQLESMRLKHDRYQAEVGEHFSTTADLLSRLNSSYRDIFAHLARGTERLGPEGARSSLNMGFSSQAAHPLSARSEQVEPPRDYAPKQNSDTGTLSEGFGLSHRRSENPDNKD